MDQNITELRNQAESAKYLYQVNEITREEAENMILPYAKAFNQKSEELAKKYHQRPQKFSLAAYLR